MGKPEELKKIHDEVLALDSSPLYGFRIDNAYSPVIGEGDADSHIMFVGEAPGETEAKCGRPFCGRAGKVLDELLGSIGMDRGKVYITNLVNDRPPENRDPKPNEIKLYGKFLERQIDIIKPKVIATLGRHSMEYVFGRYGIASCLDAISKIHGKEFKATASYGEVIVIALYHPAFALYNGTTKTQMKEDFKILSKYK